MKKKAPGQRSTTQSKKPKLKTKASKKASTTESTEALAPEIIAEESPENDTDELNQLIYEQTADESEEGPAPETETESEPPLETDVEDIEPSKAVILASKEESAPAALDALQKYLSEIRKYPLITPEHERELAIRYKETGDRKAAEALVTANLRFVVKIAAEYSRFGARMIDLIQEGNVGLMHAVREFNPYKGVRLITYAVWWIRGYIQEYLMKNYSQVRIGTTQAQKKLFYHLNREKARLDAIGGNPGDLKLLSSRLGVSEDEIRDMERRISGRDLSLDAPQGDGDQAKRWIENQADVSTPSVEDSLALGEEKTIFRREIAKIIPDLNEKERYLLHHRILGDPPQTLQEVGDHFKITRERARQLEERVISKIKEHFRSVFPDYQIKIPNND